jgi:acetylornithine/N-succinyldiaminopimelate aminotransferase
VSASSHLSSAETVELFRQYVIPNYVRYPVNLVRGEGSYVWDSEGNRYLDLFPGWGCNLLGHCPPAVVQAVQEQVATLIHAPNSWHMEAQGRWAQMLAERSFHGQAFFCNSGTEANEAAIKLARLHTPPERYKIITFTGGFHGRTLGSTAATAQPKYHEGLGPLMAGFVYAPFGDLDAVGQLVDDETAAILVEPVQGEGGIRIPPDGFLPGLRELADRHGLLLIFDEVQSGCGRTGHWFAYQHFGVTPDVMTLAKGLGGGVPIGAVAMSEKAAQGLTQQAGGAVPHATTFGGNPLACASALAVLEIIDSERLLERVGELGEYLDGKLRELVGEFPGHAVETRGRGLLRGLAVSGAPATVVAKAREKGLLLSVAGDKVVRFAPPFVIEKQHVDEAVGILRQVLAEGGGK